MLIFILLLILTQRELIVYAYLQRGYLAIGGEFLIIPLIIALMWAYDKYKKEGFFKDE